MKPKYYPHITGLAVAFMTIAPLCIVMSLPGPDDAELDALLADQSSDFVLDATVSDDEASAALDAALAYDAPVSPPTPSHAPIDSPPVAKPQKLYAPVTAPANVEPYVDTRMAALPAPQVSRDVAPENTRPLPPPRQSDTDAVREMAVADAQTSHSNSASNAAASSVPPPTTMMNVESPFDSDLPPVAPVVADASVAVDARSEDVAAMEEDATDEDYVAEPFVEPKVNPPSTFDATGHLALAGGTMGAVGGTPKTVAPPAGKSGDVSAVRAGDEKATSSNSKSRRRRSDKDERPASGDPPVIDSPRIINPFAPGLGQEAAAPLADIILQQPLESRPVSKIENLVAVTKAQGYPIALVRSDLPDDHWWVQQMVGIRGNAFAARVNFGNADSIPGSVYHLVIVFLDSPDEVRRFRIAKQFKELPEGIRRTREFTFVRR